MDDLYFGTAGVPLSTKKRSTIEGIKRVRELGLDAMELEFVQGVRMGEKLAEKVKKTAVENKVILTVHAPYFINLNSKDPEKVEASIRRIVESAKIGYLAGAQSVCFHPAYYHDDEPDKVYERVKSALLKVKEILDKEGIKITLRPETMGKINEFGTLEELLRLSQEVPGVEPLIDFAHLHARSFGKYNSFEEFINLFETIEKELGREYFEHVHFHVSGIEYDKKRGEKRHLVFEEADFNYEDLLRAFHHKGIRGVVICESPNLEEDALILKNTWKKLKGG
jgi:deoxyribonuclease-4